VSATQPSPRRRRFLDARRRLALLLVVAAGLAIALAVVLRQSHDRAGGPTLAQLAAKNYRVLSRDESDTLLRYAKSEHGCLVSRGAKVSSPVASRTRILMRAPNQSAHRLGQLELACDPTVGPPPSNATLQARPGQVLVYLPKRCLLDPTALPQS